jgi:hypothetical protein
MAKWYAKATRDFTRTISLGTLQVTSLQSGETRDIAPPRVHHIECKAGTVSMHRTKKERDAHIAAVNAENPGAMVPA